LKPQQKRRSRYEHTVAVSVPTGVSARERRQERHKHERARARELQRPAVRPLRTLTLARLRVRLPRLRLGWRLLSFSMVVVLLGVLVLFFDGDAFYVHYVEVGGLHHVPPEEIYGLSGVANVHIFWVDPWKVARDVECDSAIATAEVAVRWPSRVLIRVVEREPALVWEQAGVRAWVDVRGYVMPMRADLPGLLRIVVEGTDEPVAPYSRIGKDIVDGALQLRALRPNIDVLFYRPIDGLGLVDGRGWRVYFGTGTDMPQKLLVYETLVDEVWQEGNGVWPHLFDVGDLRAPYYRVSSG
jgi:hypothetical protein